MKAKLVEVVDALFKSPKQTMLIGGQLFSHMVAGQVRASNSVVMGGNIKAEEAVSLGGVHLGGKGFFKLNVSPFSGKVAAFLGVDFSIEKLGVFKRDVVLLGDFSDDVWRVVQPIPIVFPVEDVILVKKRRKCYH